MSKSIPYDDTNPNEIEAYAKRLLGKCLRSFLAIEDIKEIKKSNIPKGGVGHVVEKYYFHYEPNSRPEPDFVKAGVELKTTPLKRLKNGELRPKERLVLNMINFMELINEDWKSSSFLKKNNLLLLMMFLYEQDVYFIDYIFKLIALWRWPKKDLKIIKDDWEKIKAKVIAGKAHELSESDTFYLGACTKGIDSTKRKKQPNSSTLAKPRAFSLKPTYLRSLIDREIAGDRESLKDFYKSEDAFEDFVVKKFKPFLGRNIKEINKKLGFPLNEKSKAYAVEVAKGILGVHRKKKIAEFEKADVKLKVIRLRKNGTPKEDISFPTFKYKEIVSEKWEESKALEKIDRKFFFVIFQFDDDKLILKKVMFWNMPRKDLKEVKKVWMETVKRIKKGKAATLPKKSENRVSHVRPHARNAKDTYETPQGKQVVKKCFWLNALYLKSQIEKH
ncbi:DNA mismatch repair protein [Candidatus Peregrinibacteria bacterium]|nr:DNA mismatch repair protein [Candidatus Peregrinibacteria bacterium]